MTTQLHQQQQTVLVFGSTGQQGGAVATALLSHGWKVRALVRDPASDKARKLAALGAEILQGDMSNPAAIRQAMQGIYGVFSVQPSSGQGPAYGVTDEQEIRYGKTIADIAAELNVQHLVYTSVSAAGQGPTGLGHFDSKTEIEEHIRTLNIRFTIIRPAAFMELLLLPGMGLDQGTFTFFMHPEQAFQLIAVQDIGKIAARIFNAPEEFSARTIEIAGDQLTGTDLQEILSHAAGKNIIYHRFSDALLEENAFLGKLAALVDDGRIAGNADLDRLRKEFGGLLTLEQWLQGPGKPLLAAALQAVGAKVALR